MTTTQTPTTEELHEFSLRAFRGVDAGLGLDDPTAETARKLEAQHPGHLVLIQAGKFLHGYDRSHALQSYRAIFGHTGATRNTRKVDNG